MLSLVRSLCGSISYAAEARRGDKLIIVILYFRFPYNARDQGSKKEPSKEMQFPLPITPQTG